MANTFLAQFTSISLSSHQASRFNLSDTLLTLQRSWPRSGDHLGLEYMAADGSIIPGQWFSDAARLGKIARATGKASSKADVMVVETANTRLLLQHKGADRRLSGLAPLLKKPAAKLLVHRPERRAVVRLKEKGTDQFIKIVRPERLEAMVKGGVMAQKLVGDKLATPTLLDVNLAMGTATWSALPGKSLNDLLNHDEITEAASKAGWALQVLHRTQLPADIGCHKAQDEARVLVSWLERLTMFEPLRGRQVSQLAVSTLNALQTNIGNPVLLHRDYYDKQIFIAEDGQVGLLDFDTLTSGEGALDLANALVHFELRALLNRCPPEQAQVAAQAMLAAYQPGDDVCQRLNTYADASRLRLACLYSFRPYGLPIVPEILEKVGQSIV